MEKISIFYKDFTFAAAMIQKFDHCPLQWSNLGGVLFVEEVRECVVDIVSYISPPMVSSVS